jgi:hypothetical protein
MIPNKFSLSKEGFWDALILDYPKQVKRFYDWIDHYEQRNDWDFLFLNNRMSRPFPEKLIKYHDLPVAMQIGIFLQYAAETVEQYPKEKFDVPILLGTHSFELFYESIREYFHQVWWNES